VVIVAIDQLPLFGLNFLRDLRSSDTSERAVGSRFGFVARCLVIKPDALGFRKLGPQSPFSPATVGRGVEGLEELPTGLVSHHARKTKVVICGRIALRGPADDPNEFTVFERSDFSIYSFAPNLTTWLRSV
jgi:hypothetical protein